MDVCINKPLSAREITFAMKDMLTVISNDVRYKDLFNWILVSKMTYSSAKNILLDEFIVAWDLNEIHCAIPDCIAKDGLCYMTGCFISRSFPMYTDKDI